MQEVLFLKQNSSRWKQLEAMLSRPHQADPDELARLFIEVTDDLSYARTFFPRSKTTQYLNGLAGRIHQLIYRNKKESKSRFVTFWGQELPRLFHKNRRYIAYSFLIFVLSALIGVVSTANDETFVRLILGDAYVNMTIENIKRGDPMAVYKQGSEAEMFSYITLNNIYVAFRTFAYGLLLSVGTVYILMINGIMLGVFQYFFYQHGLLGASALVIWIHGTLEIWAIIIAGAAGLVMGNSLLFPGTYTRRQSFMRGAREGMKMVVGLVPVFLTAGFLESFVTRHTDMPVGLSLLIIAGSMSFNIWYFLLYPRKVAMGGCS
ncbi:MAG: stage II sporulation protein M [Calditrichaeota bacterium]|nr:MAG: stage II sporulation protein M [Calditrichota bacterium]